MDLGGWWRPALWALVSSLSSTGIKIQCQPAALWLKQPREPSLVQRTSHPRPGKPQDSTASGDGAQCLLRERASSLATHSQWGPNSHSASPLRSPLLSPSPFSVSICQLSSSLLSACPARELAGSVLCPLEGSQEHRKCQRTLNKRNATRECVLLW